jgi:hypothetical protein
MRRCLLITCISMFVICLDPLFGVAGENITIDWELVGRYRLLTDPKPGDALGELALLADDLRGGVVDEKYSLEFNKKITGFAERNGFILDGGSLTFKKKPSANYSPDTGKYSPGYADPTAWHIALKASGTGPSDKCEWRRNGAVLKGQGDCGHFEPDETFSKETATVELFVNETRAGTVSIAPKNLLVVGLGDSYASGEGNPDVKKSRLYWFGPKGEWLDKKCHRSLFSWQSLVAARLAREQKDRSVTFLSFACSGAETRHLVRNEYEGVEPGEKTNDSEVIESQLTALKRELCPGNWSESDERCSEKLIRPDLVLVSSGGNDVGFGPLIVSMIMTSISHDVKNKTVKQEVPLPTNEEITFTHFVESSGTDLKWKYIDRLKRDISLVMNDLDLLSDWLFDPDPYFGFGDTHVIQANYPNPLMKHVMEKGKMKEEVCVGDDGYGKPTVHLDGYLGWGIIDGVLRFFGLVEQENELKAIKMHFVEALTKSVHTDGIGLLCRHANKEDKDRLETLFLDDVAADTACVRYKKADVETKHRATNLAWTPVALAYPEELLSPGETIPEDFLVNGYCLREDDVTGRWFNILKDSFHIQGDQFGAFHPNIYGHLYYVKRIFPAARAALGEQTGSVFGSAGSSKF